MPSLALTAAMIVSTSQAMNTSRPSGAVTITPMPKVTRVMRNRITPTISRVMLKFSASLAWSLAKGMESFLTSQMTSGPTMLPTPPVNNPVKADRWPNSAHCRSSRLDSSCGAGGGAVYVSNSLIA